MKWVTKTTAADKRPSVWRCRGRGSTPRPLLPRTLTSWTHIWALVVHMSQTWNRIPQNPPHSGPGLLRSGAEHEKENKDPDSLTSSQLLCRHGEDDSSLRLHVDLSTPSLNKHPAHALFNIFGQITRPMCKTHGGRVPRPSGAGSARPPFRNPAIQDRHITTRRLIRGLSGRLSRASDPEAPTQTPRPRLRPRGPDSDPEAPTQTQRPRLRPPWTRLRPPRPRLKNTN